MFGGCNKVVVAECSHRRSPGSITQNSQIRVAKQTPIWRYATVSQEAKLINFDIVNLLEKSNGGRCRMCVILSFGGLVVLFASEWVAIA